MLHSFSFVLLLALYVQMRFFYFIHLRWPLLTLPYSSFFFSGGGHSHSHDHEGHDHAHEHAHAHSLEDLSVGLSILCEYIPHTCPIVFCFMTSGFRPLDTFFAICGCPLLDSFFPWTFVDWVVADCFFLPGVLNLPLITIALNETNLFQLFQTFHRSAISFSMCLTSLIYFLSPCV